MLPIHHIFNDTCTKGIKLPQIDESGSYIFTTIPYGYVSKIIDHTETQTHNHNHKQIQIKCLHT